MVGKTLRIIDANLNRASEGLRLLEDIARLELNDVGLSERLKTLRHEIVRGDLTFNQRLLQARNAAGDVGVNLEVRGEERQREVPTLVVANSRRVQESLRVLEEMAKVPGLTLELDSEKFKQARFALYTIEQELLSKMGRQDKRKRIRGLYVIVDTAFLKGRSHTEVAAAAIHGGASIIQLRDKVTGKRELLAIARELKALCAEHKVLFFVNDHLDVALASDADGLHVGQGDLPAAVARQLLPLGKMLGISARTVALATAAESNGADYIATGSIYPTTSKEGAEVVGLERLRQVRQAVSVPLVAIGGINKDNAAEVIAAGADAVCVISAVLAAENVERAAREIVERIKGAK